MTALLAWKITAALLGTPGALVVLRALAKRIGTVPKRAASEVDYLRDECKREREEARIAVRDALAAERADCAVEIEDREQEIARLRHVIDRMTNEVGALEARAKVAEHDLETARRFVDGATTTRRDKR